MVSAYIVGGIDNWSAYPILNNGPQYDPDKPDNEKYNEILARLRTLTPQQARVLGLVAQGMFNEQIAYELGVSEPTIKAHVSAILRKFDVFGRTQAAIAVSRIEDSYW